MAAALPVDGAATGPGAGPPGTAPWLRPLLMFGSPGVGKSTLARALVNDLAAASAGGQGHGGGALAVYADVARLLAGHRGDAGKVVAAVFKVRMVFGCARRQKCVGGVLHRGVELAAAVLGVRRRGWMVR
eukprot:71708-Chlamydomonas_euryale.AAC.1